MFCFVLLCFSLNMCWVIWMEEGVSSLWEGARGCWAAGNLAGEASRPLWDACSSHLVCLLASCLWASGPSSHSPILFPESHVHVTDPTRQPFCINRPQTHPALLERVPIPGTSIHMAPVRPQTLPLLCLPVLCSNHINIQHPSQQASPSAQLCPECTYFPSPHSETFWILNALLGHRPHPHPRQC